MVMEFLRYPTDEIVFRNPTTGEVIDTPEKYDADVQRMEEAAKTEREADIEPKTIEEILPDEA